MLRANRPILAFFDAIKALRIRQLAVILKTGYDPNLMINARGQNGLQFMINYFNATDAHFRLQAPINRSAYLSMAKLLLDSGLDPNALDLLADETVIFDAIRYNDREMVALLLDYVDVSLRNKTGETALMCAARFGSKQITRLLLDHLRHLEMDGYFLRQRNRFGLTPLEIARSENLEAAKVITKHLISYGHHAGALLARSVSHHQLDPRRTVAAASVNRFGAAPRPALAAAVADGYISPSDYDSDEAVGLMGVGRPLARRPILPAATDSMGLGGSRSYGQAYIDPRAAEFSQYLMEQHQQVDSSSSGLRAGPAQLRRAAVSDDDNDDNDYGQYGGSRPAAAGALVRSRSCMLGPGSSSMTTANSRSKSVAKKHEQGSGSSKVVAAGWQDQSSLGQVGQ